MSGLSGTSATHINSQRFHSAAVLMVEGAHVQWCCQCCNDVSVTLCVCVCAAACVLSRVPVSVLSEYFMLAVRLNLHIYVIRGGGSCGMLSVSMGGLP